MNECLFKNKNNIKRSLMGNKYTNNKIYKKNINQL